MSSVTEWKVVVGLSYEDAETLLSLEEDFTGDVYDFMEENLHGMFPAYYTTLNCGYDTSAEVFGVEMISCTLYSKEVNLVDLGIEAEILSRKLNSKFNTGLFKVYIGTNTY